MDLSKLVRVGGEGTPLIDGDACIGMMINGVCYRFTITLGDDALEQLDELNRSAKRLLNKLEREHEAN